MKTNPQETADRIMIHCTNYEQAIRVCDRIIALSPYRELRWHYRFVRILLLMNKKQNNE